MVLLGAETLTAIVRHIPPVLLGKLRMATVGCQTYDPSEPAPYGAPRGGGGRAR